MGGFISGLIPFSLLVQTWYPFVGGTQLVSGHHILWMVLAYGLTNKKSAMFVTATIKGFVMFLLGAQWGILEVFINNYEAFFVCIGIIFLARFHEGDSKLGWGIAAGIGNVSQVPFFWFLSGKFYLLHYTLFIMACMFAFASGVIIAGYLGKVITNKIRQAGVVL